jgi:hypothetical protein
LYVESEFTSLTVSFRLRLSSFCFQGFLLRIGGKDQLLDGATHEYAAGSASGSTFYGMRVDDFPNEKPKNIVDLFNVKAFPGVLGVGKSLLGVIELALIIFFFESNGAWQSSEKTAVLQNL